MTTPLDSSESPTGVEEIDSSYVRSDPLASESSVSTSTLITAAASAHRRSGYFALSVFLLAVAIVGFAPTLLLRSVLGLESMPLHVYWHGALMTLWFALLTMQAALVRSGRVSLHRRIGIGSAALAACMIFVNVITLVRFIDRSEFPEFDSLIVRANLTTLIAFLLCYFSGVSCFGRPDAHRRFMIFASISVVGPAFDRIARFPILVETLESAFSGLGMPYFFAFAAVCVLVLCTVVIILDILERKRIHWATLLSIAYLLVVARLSAIALVPMIA